MFDRNKTFRISIICLTVFFAANIAYAAVPQSTIRTTGGITTYVGHYVNFTQGLYQGSTLRIDSSGDGNFEDIDLTGGIDAQEYFLNSVNITDSLGDTPTFSNITLTGPYINGYNIKDVFNINPYTYLIRYNATSSLYEAQYGKSGQVVSTNNNFGALFNSISTTIKALAPNGHRGSISLVGFGENFTSSITLEAQTGVDVYSYGVEIYIDSSSTINGVNFDSVTEAIWKNVIIHRIDTTPVTLEVHAAYFNGTCDKTLKIINCQFFNDVTGVVTNCYGINIQNASPTLIDTDGYGGQGSTNCYGINIDGTSKAQLSGCTGYAGDGGTSCNGVYIGGTSEPILTECRGFGGNGSTFCHGMIVSTESTAQLISCVGTGGNGGDSCYGLVVTGGAEPEFTGCVGNGGDGGDFCRGFTLDGYSSPKLTGCTGIGGDGGASCYGIYMDQSGAPILTSTIGMGGGGGQTCIGLYSGDGSSPTMTQSTGIGGKRTSHLVYYNSANNGRFQPYTGHPYQIIGIKLVVTTAQPGKTLDLGTSIGGDEVANNVDIGTTGSKYFNFNMSEVVSGGYLYATPSAAISNNVLTIRYIVMTNYADSYGLLITSRGGSKFLSGTLISNGASDTVYILDTAEDADAWIISNSHIETLDPVNQKSIKSESAYDPAPVYNCVLVGALSNIVPANASSTIGTCIIK